MKLFKLKVYNYTGYVFVGLKWVIYQAICVSLYCAL